MKRLHFIGLVMNAICFGMCLSGGCFSAFVLGNTTMFWSNVVMAILNAIGFSYFCYGYIVVEKGDDS